MASGGDLGRVRIGSTGVEVTRLVLGCAPIGGLYEAVSAEDAAAALEQAWRLGVRSFDTAPHYGAGLAERRLGAFLATVPVGQATVSTKVGRLLRPAGPDGAPAPPEFAGEDRVHRVRDYSAAGVRRSLEESLERLGLDRVDVALVHDPEDHLDEALAGALPELARLRAAGVVGAIGAGMNLCAPLERIVAEADVDCVLVAGRYSLLDQGAAARLLPLCEARRVSVLVGGVFNSGVLADVRPGARFDYRPASDEVLERARAIALVCERHGVPLKAAAIRFPLRHPAVSAVVVGARSAAEVAEDVDCFQSEVPEALYDELAARRLVRSEVGSR
ncbi:MAG TPA: aldo/keto reductase [Acidimicrobiales bacterium]|nr:aldo/keto reductase [Acidimicrobiales bacterium]